jgi:non-specific serine/threonine protein kinase
MTDRMISHYRVLEKIGEGGMGEVYRAEDLQLKRIVALKFLSTRTLGTAEEKTRFVHEAQSAASLNHPNICTVHEIGEHEGSPFIVMEYVEGASLRDRMGAGAMSLDDAVDIAAQIAAGLKAAHNRGIVHRDIKPANIMLTADGRVKIMDFGLAKGPGAAKLTQTGTTVGTVAYMAPEQGRGDNVDLRADVWSLGAVFYELITGHQPFRGEHEQAMMYSIFNEDPPPLADLRPDAPRALQDVVSRCLEKDPWQRYPDTGAFADALGQIALKDESRSTPAGRPRPDMATGRGGIRWLFVTGAIVVIAAAILIGYSQLRGPVEKPAAPKLTKIAVLFFENLGPESDAYFADGITDAITARLFRIHGLGVISRQSTIQYKGSDKSLRQIGEELGVDYVLEGTIQRERPGDPASRVRIIPQLIHVADDIHVWADTYDEDMSEVFRLQSEIAERVANALDITLLEGERELVTAEPTGNIEAYEYYLRANEVFYRDRFTMESSRNAIENYQRAVDLDPDFAAAWAGLSQAYIWMYYSFGPAESNRVQALAAVDRARELAPNMPETDIALGYYQYYGYLDFASAVTHFESALEKSPHDASILHSLAFVVRRQGKFEQSLELLQRARELDPRNGTALWDIAINYTYLRRYEDAEYYLKRLIDLEPESDLAYVELAELYLRWDGNGNRAIPLLESAPIEGSAFSWLSNIPEFAIITPQIPDLITSILDEEIEVAGSSADTAVFYVCLAEMHFGMGDTVTANAYYDSAITTLETPSPQRQKAVDYGAYYCMGYARRGLRDNAIQCAEDALREMPIERDAMLGPAMAASAAKVFVVAGEYDRALELLEAVMAAPAELSVALLRNDPIWDPLRDSPRFQKLIESDP